MIGLLAPASLLPRPSDVDEQELVRVLDLLARTCRLQGIASLAFDEHRTEVGAPDLIRQSQRAAHIDGFDLYTGAALAKTDRGALSPF